MLCMLSAGRCYSFVDEYQVSAHLGRILFRNLKMEISCSFFLYILAWYMWQKTEWEQGTQKNTVSKVSELS